MPKLNYRMSQRRLMKSGVYLLASLASLKIVGATHPGKHQALAQGSVQTLAYSVGAYGQGVYPRDQEFRSGYQSYLPLVSQ